MVVNKKLRGVSGKGKIASRDLYVMIAFRPLESSDPEDSEGIVRFILLRCLCVGICDVLQMEQEIASGYDGTREGQ